MSIYINGCDDSPRGRRLQACSVVPKVDQTLSEVVEMSMLKKLLSNLGHRMYI